MQLGEKRLCVTRTPQHKNACDMMSDKDEPRPAMRNCLYLLIMEVLVNVCALCQIISMSVAPWQLFA